MRNIMYKVEFEDIGSMNYNDAWKFQEELFNKVISEKKEENTNGYLLFVEHPHVYTLGKSGNEENLLIDILKLNQLEAEFIKTNRGGDITYHGPGQIVGYPILDLDKIKIGIKEYVFRIESSVINTLKEFDIESGRKEGATGVWLDCGSIRERKICAIGIKAGRSVTMHGFAFNINTDLNYFNMINPCGFTSNCVTSLEKELGAKQDMSSIKIILKKHLAETIDFEIV